MGYALILIRTLYTCVLAGVLAYVRASNNRKSDGRVDGVIAASSTLQEWEDDA